MINWITSFYQSYGIFIYVLAVILCGIGLYQSIVRPSLGWIVLTVVSAIPISPYLIPQIVDFIKVLFNPDFTLGYEFLILWPVWFLLCVAEIANIRRRSGPTLSLKVKLTMLAIAIFAGIIIRFALAGYLALQAFGQGCAAHGC
jgi:hypothetical protein